MFVIYQGPNGTYQHLPGEVNYQLRCTPIVNEAEFPIGRKVRVDLVGKLITQKDGQAGQDELTQKIIALGEAYVSGGDLILMLNNDQPSPHSIYSAKCLGGLRVVNPPEFPDGGAAQYVTQRDYTIGLEAEIPGPLAAGSLWSFEESVDFEGTGGPEIGAVVPLRGVPVIQTLHQLTPMRIIQRGQAVGYLGYWSKVFNPPIYPALEVQNLRRVGTKSARAIGFGQDRDYKLFPSYWQYVFLSPGPLAGGPTQWPLSQ